MIVLIEGLVIIAVAMIVLLVVLKLLEMFKGD
jgi:hypothetical protein